MKFATAKTVQDSFLALECWVKLKSALVMPLKAGRQRKSASRKFHEKQMMRWLAWEHEECWQTAITIEHRRQTLIKRRNSQRQKGFINREDNKENNPQLLGEQLTITKY